MSLIRLLAWVQRPVDWLETRFELAFTESNFISARVHGNIREFPCLSSRISALRIGEINMPRHDKQAALPFFSEATPLAGPPQQYPAP